MSALSQFGRIRKGDYSKNHMSNELRVDTTARVTSIRQAAGGPVTASRTLVPAEDSGKAFTLNTDGVTVTVPSTYGAAGGSNMFGVDNASISTGITFSGTFNGKWVKGGTFDVAPISGASSIVFNSNAVVGDSIELIPTTASGAFVVVTTEAVNGVTVS